MDNWTKVIETGDMQYAELLKSMLLNEEIEAVTLNQRDSSYTMLGTVSVYVPNDMAERATALINAHTGE